MLAAVAIAMSPPAVVSLGLVVAVAVAAALLGAGHKPRRRLVLRQSILLGGGLGLALALLLPWSGRLLTGEALRDLGPLMTAPALLDLLQLHPGGPGLPTWLIGPLYPMLALAALLLVPTRRRRQVVWLLTGFLGAAVVAAGQAKGLSPLVTDWPATMLIPGAVAWAAAAGLALIGLRQLLVEPGRWVTMRRAAAAGLVLLGVGTALLVVGHLTRGAWSPLQRAQQQTAFAAVSDPDARVLWVAGRPDHSVDLSITGPAGRTFLDPGRVLPPAADQALRSLIDDIVNGRVRNASAMLHTFGIGWVAVEPGPDAQRLRDAMVRQGMGSREVSVGPATQRYLVPVYSLMVPGYQQPIPPQEGVDMAVRGIPEPVRRPRMSLAAPGYGQPIPPAEVIDLSAGRTVSSETLYIFESTGTPPTAMRLSAQVPPARAQAIIHLDPLASLGAGTMVQGPATIVTPFPASSGWQADLDGQPLTPVTALGWARAFQVPAGVKGTLSLNPPAPLERNRYLLAEAVLLLGVISALFRPTGAAPITPSPLRRSFGLQA